MDYRTTFFGQSKKPYDTLSMNFAFFVARSNESPVTESFVRNNVSGSCDMN